MLAHIKDSVVSSLERLRRGLTDQDLLGCLRCKCGRSHDPTDKPSDDGSRINRKPANVQNRNFAAFIIVDTIHELDGGYSRNVGFSSITGRNSR
jgi:hypothetical protein